MAREIALKWEGPRSLDTPQHRAQFTPPKAAGVYLWTVPAKKRLLVSYVGQAGNLSARFYQHIYFTLGGASWLYDPAVLQAGIRPGRERDAYAPDPARLNRHFLDNFAELSKRAYDNLTSYRFFWATAPGDHATLMALESALIEHAREREQPLQNESLSQGPGRVAPMIVRSTFEGGQRPDILDSFEFGTFVEAGPPAA